MNLENTYTAFAGNKLLSKGSISEVVLKIKRAIGRADQSAVLIFSDLTGKVIDFNFQGTEKDVLKRLGVYVTDLNPTETPGPGRPKLGVISREVSLLPRHWEWLASQSGGASAILRKLVDEAKKKSSEGNFVKSAQERTHKFMSVLGGDLPGFEEALRALYKKDGIKFSSHIESWPRDIKAHLNELADLVFTKSER